MARLTLDILPYWKMCKVDRCILWRSIFRPDTHPQSSLVVPKASFSRDHTSASFPKPSNKALVAPVMSIHRPPVFDAAVLSRVLSNRFVSSSAITNKLGWFHTHVLVSWPSHHCPVPSALKHTLRSTAEHNHIRLPPVLIPYFPPRASLLSPNSLSSPDLSSSSNLAPPLYFSSWN